jgi:pimeloyl-ACP methyl ester carboxylesterase
MRNFRRTICLHGYSGSPDGSVKHFFDQLVLAMGPDHFGEVSFPMLAFSKENGTVWDDPLPTKLALFQDALAACQDWDLQDTLVIGTSLGGLLGACLAQQQGKGTVVALSSPDHLDDATGVTGQPADILSVFSSQDDAVIHGRTSRWTKVSPFCIDLPGLTHDHGQHTGLLLLPTIQFLHSYTPQVLRDTLQEAENFPIPF